jgi:hypothetical protein
MSDTVQQAVQENLEKSSIVYEENGILVNFRFAPSEGQIWGTAQNIADLFEADVRNIRRHIENIYEDEELEESATKVKFTLVQNEGGRYVEREITHYSIDVAISVGYRLNANKRATAFRKWSNGVLRAYIEQGYVINEKILRESPEKLNKLATEIRALRAEEKQVYEKVRECFKISASDYTPGAQEVKNFYALLQDKFHHAITGMTSSKLILDRADHHEKNMGLQTIKGDFPTTKEVVIGKNYLFGEELYRLHLLSEQFLLYAESTALAKRPMTMKSLHEQLDRLLTLNNYPVFHGYTDYLKDEAHRYAKQELVHYKKRMELEAQGLEYDPEMIESGEYNYLLDEINEI